MNEDKKFHYGLRECPYCHRMFGNVKNHIALKHKVADAAEPVDITKEDLLGNPAPELEETSYTCGSCRARVRKGEASCSNCSAELSWEGVA